MGFRPIDLCVLTRAGLTIVPVVPWEGALHCQRAPDQLPNFYQAVLTFERSV